MSHLTNEELLLKHLTQTVLYEGSAQEHLPSAVGILYPESFCEANIFAYSRMQAACVLKGKASARLSVRVRFLQVEKAGEALEREICPRDTTIGKLVQSRAVCYFVSTPNTPAGLKGRVVSQASPIAGCKDAYQVVLTIENCTNIEHPQSLPPEAMLRLAFVSTHAVLNIEEGEFISAQNPPEEWAAAVAACKNHRTYPVLLDESNRTVFCSPVMFFDHPLIPTNLSGDIFEVQPSTGKGG
jgi:hypothetical protein